MEQATTAEEIRRDFATAWGEIGAAWGVTPSTAMVQGYLLVHGGPLSEPEIRRALGLSHRAASLALAQCEQWGLVQRTADARRSGLRGPAATAWALVGDHWEWFRRVAAARKQRETDPVMPVIERCARLAREAAAGETADPELRELRDRLAVLLQFVRRFDRGVELFVRGNPVALESVFATLERLDTATADRLWAMVESMDADELTTALTALSRLPPAAVRRLVGLADQPTLRKLLGIA